MKLSQQVHDNLTLVVTNLHPCVMHQRTQNRTYLVATKLICTVIERYNLYMNIIHRMYSSSCCIYRTCICYHMNQNSISLRIVLWRKPQYASSFPSLMIEVLNHISINKQGKEEAPSQLSFAISHPLKSSTMQHTTSTPNLP